jgi:DNA-binding ferritin-like protein
MSENTTSQASSKAQFEELRDKFEERLGQLSKQIDELSERFQKGATDAKASVEADLHKLKAEHQAEYEQFQKLQKVAEESWGMLQKRLDTIATEMRSVVGQAVGQAASALGIAHSEQTDATAQSQAAEPAAPAAPSAPDAGTDAAPSAKQ